MIYLIKFMKSVFLLNDGLSLADVKKISPVTLAFVGDAVYTLFVRENLVFLKDEKGDVLNRKASEMVCATAQADFADKLIPELTEDELYVYKRGRNAKKATHAKHADVHDYVKSTGLEALIGYLYLSGQLKRLADLMSKAGYEPANKAGISPDESVPKTKGENNES